MVICLSLLQRAVHAGSLQLTALLERTQITDLSCHLYFTLCTLCLGPEAVQQSTKAAIR